MRRLLSHILGLLLVTGAFYVVARGQNGGTAQIGHSFIDCVASATCAAPVNRSFQLKVATGRIAFSSSTTAAVSGISPAFSATADYACVAMDPTNVYTHTIKNTGAGAFTITAGTSNSDTWTWTCVGY